jgi:hypothetical protein
LTYPVPGIPEKQSPVSSLLSQVFSYDAENRLVEVKTAIEETVSVTFQPGWNFFALPVLPANGAVVVLLPSFAQDFEQIAKFEPATGKFSHYVGNPKFDDFTTLEYGVGYQVYCKASSPVTVRFTGKLPTKKLSQSVGVGWHLLGFTGLTTTSAASWLTGVDYTDVRDAALSPITQVEPGRAGLLGPGAYHQCLLTRPPPGSEDDLRLRWGRGESQAARRRQDDDPLG